MIKWNSTLSPELSKLFDEGKAAIENEFCENKNDSKELDYRTVWWVWSERLMKQNFSSLVPEFMEKIPDEQLRMLPIVLKVAEWADTERLFDRFNSIVMLENDRRNNEKMEKYNRQLIIYTMVLTRLTWALVGIGIATILVTAIAIFIQCK